eukprot:scaffold367_cov254-Pinguiococcus_pyrenoidosus.AAC.16
MPSAHQSISGPSTSQQNPELGNPLRSRVLFWRGASLTELVVKGAGGSLQDLRRQVLRARQRAFKDTTSRLRSWALAFAKGLLRSLGLVGISFVGSLPGDAQVQALHRHSWPERRQRRVLPGRSHGGASHQREIGELEIPVVVQQHVLRRQVAENQMMGMQELQSHDQLGGVELHDPLVEEDVVG